MFVIRIILHFSCGHLYQTPTIINVLIKSETLYLRLCLPEGLVIISKVQFYNY